MFAGVEEAGGFAAIQLSRHGDDAQGLESFVHGVGPEQQTVSVELDGVIVVAAFGGLAGVLEELLCFGLVRVGRNPSACGNGALRNFAGISDVFAAHACFDGARTHSQARILCIALAGLK